jgi:hypothetical protein
MNMVTEAIASYYTRIADRWMVSEDSENPISQSNQPINRTVTLQNYLSEKRTQFSRFVVPTEENTNVYWNRVIAL